MAESNDFEIESEDWDLDHGALPRDSHDTAIKTLLQQNRRILKDYAVKEKEMKKLSEEFAERIQTKNTGTTRWTSMKSDCKEGKEFCFVQSDPKKIYVSNINFRTSQRKLWDFFAMFGQVNHFHLLRNHNGKSKGRGFVTFVEEAAVEHVLSLTEEELDLDLRTLHVELATYKKFTSDAPTKPAEIDSQMVEPLLDAGDGSSETDVLKDDVILHVFGFLSLRELLTCQQVCHRWSYLSRKSLHIFKHLSFDFLRTRFIQGFTCRHLRNLLKRHFRVLQSIDLSMLSTCLGNDSLGAIADHCPEVLHLNISQLPVSNPGLFTLTDKCKHIQTIKMNNCRNLSEKGFWKLFKECKNLQDVHVDNNWNITGKCFYLLTEKLVRLSLQGCSQVADVALEKLSANCPNLKEINLGFNHSLSSAALAHLSKLHLLQIVNLTGLDIPLTHLKLDKFSDLRELHMDSCSSVTADFLSQLGKYCPQLRVLDVSNTPIQLRSVKQLHACPLLHTLKANRVLANGIGSEILGEDSSLLVLQLLGCKDLTHQDVNYIVRRSSRLEELDISYTDVMNDVLHDLVLILTAEPHRRLIIRADGTDIEPGGVELPSNLTIVKTFSQSRKEDIIDIDDDCWCSDDDSLSPDEHFDDDDAYNYLDGDDPMFEERFELL